MVKEKKQSTATAIPEMEWKVANIVVVGETPLLTCRWREEQIEAIRRKQGQEPPLPPAPRDPQQEFEGSIYYTDDGKPGMIAIAFKRAAVRAAKQVDLVMVDMESRFHINADIVEIVGSKPEFRRDMVKPPQGAAMPAYRAMYREWSCVLPVYFNSSLLPLANLLQLIDLGGSVGVGAWRPEKKGRFGMFKVAREAKT